MKRFEHHTAIVTGAGSGLGRAFALRLLHEGARVLALDLDRLEELAGEAGSAALTTMRCDVSEPEQVAAAFARARSDLEGPDLLFNNAGIGLGGVRLHDLEIDEYDRVMGVNARGAFVVMKHGIAAMLQTGRGGAIVNTGSTAASKPNPLNGAYGAAKAALMLMTRQAAVEYARDNIRINALMPGLVRTRIIEGVDDEKLEGIAAAIPMGRTGTPEEMASVALFLASDEASYVTGACLNVDGGYMST